MQYEKALMEFLSKPENLRIALEIADNAPSLINDIENKLWNALNESLENESMIQNFPKWTLYYDSRKAIELRQNDLAQKGNVLKYIIERPGDTIVYGLKWTTRNVEKIDLPAFLLGLTDGKSDSKYKFSVVNPAWADGFKIDRNGLIELANTGNIGGIVEKINRPFLDLVTETHRIIETENQKIIEEGNK